MSTYQLRLPGFEGPLDLLLQLIERRQMDITTVSLALVTDQYLGHLRSGEGVDPEQLSEFVAVAAKLLLIKSLALLPRQDRPRPEEPPPDPTDLTERLREYEAVRRAALHLRSREDAELRSYPHHPPVLPLSLPPNGREDGDHGGDVGADGHENGHARGSSIWLLTALRRVAGRTRDEPVALARDAWTVAEAIAWLLRAVRRGSGGSFHALVAGIGRTRLVAAFLALLELHRQGKLVAHQPAPFADVRLDPADEPAEAAAVGGASGEPGGEGEAGCVGEGDARALGRRASAGNDPGLHGRG